MRKLPAFTAVAVLVLAGALAGCRGGTTSTTAKGASTDVGVTKEACPQPVNKINGCI
jgi:hypothetical protein